MLVKILYSTVHDVVASKNGSPNAIFLCPFYEITCKRYQDIPRYVLDDQLHVYPSAFIIPNIR